MKKDLNGFTHLHITMAALTFTHHAEHGAVLHTFTKKLYGSFQVG